MDAVSYSKASSAYKLAEQAIVGLTTKADLTTSGILVPVGTNVTRPTLGAGEAAIRFNTDLGGLEEWNGTAWKNVSADITAVAIKGTDTVANILAMTGMVAEDLWIASDTLDGYVYDGSSWINIGSLRGPQGIQGIQGIQGEAGNGVSTIIKTSTVGLVDTYTITFTDTTTTTFDVTNGLNGTNGVDGQDIEHVSKTSGTGAAGTTDIYTVWGDIGETINLGTFNVYNGADGAGVGDMLKATYDTTNNGVVDNAELVNGLTVETAVPVGAVFTDTVYDPAAIETLINKTLDSIDNWIGANHIHYTVKAVEDLPAGVIVMGVGYNSEEDVFEVAKWTVASGKPALGMNHHALLNGEIGSIVQSGQIKDIDTSLLTVGVVYYPADGGLLTAIKPTTGSYQAAVYVLRSHSSQGAVTVNFAAPIEIASTTKAGYVQLNDTLTSTSMTEALTAAQGKALQDRKQPIDATLTALAGITVAADKLIYATGVDTFGTTTISAYGRSILDDVDAETARTTLEISATNTPSIAVGGVTATNVQAAIQELDSKKATSTHTHTGVYEPADATILKDADIGSTVQAYDVDTAKLDVLQTFTAAQRSNITTDNDLSFNLAVANKFKCTPTALGTLTFTNLAAQSGTVILNNTGGFAISLAASIKAKSGVATTLSTAGVYLIGYDCDGTNVYITVSAAMV